MADEKQAKKAAAETFRGLTQGLVRSEGLWRLSVALGVLGISLWSIFSVYILVVTNTNPLDLLGIGLGLSPYANIDPQLRAAANRTFNILILGLPSSFIIPWAIIQLIGWVTEGFKKGSK
jgi:hypothetical protein